MLYLFIVGFISILGQVALLRELNVAFYGVELVYFISLGLWLLFTAAGTWAGGIGSHQPRSLVAVFLVAFAFLLPVDIAFVRSIRLVFSGVPGAYLPFPTQLLALSLSLLPVGLLLGGLFRLSAESFVSSGKPLALAYAIESAGGIAGGLSATLFLKFGIQNFRVALLCSMAALIPIVSVRTTRPGPARYLAGLPLIVLMGVFWQGGMLDRMMTSWTHPHVVESRDSPYCRVTVTRSGGQTSVFQDDVVCFNSEGTDAEEFVHLTATQHPQPSRILILGGGVEGLVGEVLKYSPDRVDYVELDSVLLEVLERCLPAEFNLPLHRPNVKVTAADPRVFLSSLASMEKYDLILVGTPEPSSGQANRFYTEEFYRQCRRCLDPGGIIGFRLKSSENYWTLQLAQRLSSIYRAVHSAFPHVLVLPGTTNIVIASSKSLSPDPEIPAARLRQRRVAGRLVSPAYLRYVYQNDRFAQIRALLQKELAPPNTDVRPICYQLTAVLWLSKFYPSLSRVDMSALAARAMPAAGPALLLFAAAALALALCRRLPGVRRIFLMTIAGFLGMVLETLLILHYQVKNGVLFQDLGILLMSFMAGLSGGAILVERWLRSRKSGWKKARAAGLALVLGFVLATAWIAFRTFSAGMGLFETSLLLALAGILVAGVFALESAQAKDGRGSLVSSLYSADLIGGCAGSLAASLVLIPIAGLGVTALYMIPISLLAAVLVP